MLVQFSTILFSILSTYPVSCTASSFLPLTWNAEAETIERNKISIHGTIVITLIQLRAEHSIVYSVFNYIFSIQLHIQYSITYLVLNYIFSIQLHIQYSITYSVIQLHASNIQLNEFSIQLHEFSIQLHKFRIQLHELIN